MITTARRKTNTEIWKLEKQKKFNMEMKENTEPTYSFMYKSMTIIRKPN